MAILVALAVNEDGYREVLGAAKGMKEDKASRVSFFQWLRLYAGRFYGYDFTVTMFQYVANALSLIPLIAK